MSESNDKKTEANKLFSSASYDNAISKYEEAASVCPHYLDYELAVLQSNISACHLKLEQWKEAVTSASKALDGLEKIEKADAAAAATDPRVKEEDEDVEEEIVSTGAQKSAPAQGQESDAEVAARKRKEDILRIRAKALMRRARAKSELDGWANLSGAEEDYKALSVMDNLSPADRKIVASQLRSLPQRTKAAQEKEMAEMWGKLKDVSLSWFKKEASDKSDCQNANDTVAGKWHSQAVWPEHRQLQHGQGRKDRRLQHELQPEIRLIICRALQIRVYRVSYWCNYVFDIA